MTLKYFGHKNREALYDVTPSPSESPVAVLFVHGYMGYKNWGAWTKFAEKLASTGHRTYKLNLSHNGTTIENETKFTDLEAFGKGGYWAEWNDIDRFMTQIMEKDKVEQFILVGHSRGGGMVALFAKDARVKQVHCIAPISNIEARFPKGEKLEQWESEGVYYHKNGRTNQDMPHYYSQYEDFLENQSTLNIEEAVTRSKADLFVYHGDKDESVDMIEGIAVAKWGRGFYQNIQGANHTFGVIEPFIDAQLPTHFEELIEMIKRNILSH